MSDMMHAIVRLIRRSRDRRGWTSDDYIRRGLWPPYEVTEAEARARCPRRPACCDQSGEPQ